MLKQNLHAYSSAICSVVLLCLIAGCSKSSVPSSENTVTVKVYYVSPDGSDGNTGTIKEPFKSITAALNKAVPGDTVIARGGTYNERINFPRSGTSDKRITLKAYTGEKPVIDGSNITVTGWMALVTLNSIRFITLEGFDICNLLSSTFNTDPEGIFINGNSKDITIKNCNIYNIKNSASMSDWRSGHAIFIIGNGSAAISNIVITGCTVHDTQTGTSENITLAGNVDGFDINHNTIYNTENIGIIIAGGDNLNPNGNVATNYARNGVISDNVLYDIDMSRGPVLNGDHGAIAIYVCGGAGTVIERNRVYSSDRAIGLVSESNIYATKNCIVRNNFIYNCWRTGIYLGDYLNYTHGGTKNCYVVNNTLFKNDRVVGAFGEIEGEIRLTENCDSNVIKNNVVYGRDGDVFVHKYTATGNNNIIDNNLYYTTGTAKWIWNGTPYTDFAAWKLACSGDGASTHGIDPLLVNIVSPDLHIQTTSPAKNTGVLLSSDIHGMVDIDGNPRILNNKISKGAQQ